MEDRASGSSIESGTRAERAPALPPRYSICQLTLPDTDFETDIELAKRFGATGLSIFEGKLGPSSAQQLKAFELSGLEAAVCIPKNIAPLPAEPAFPGPSGVDERVIAMCESIRRLAPFKPASILVATGAAGELSAKRARRIAVQGLRRASEAAAELGLRLSLEPIRREPGNGPSFVHTLPETFELIDEIGASNLDVAYDVYHLWDTEDIVQMTRDHATRFGVAHLSDWRADTRGAGDRAIPGEGVIDLPALLGALDDGGFSGWFDLEVISRKTYQDSLWLLDPADLLARSRSGVATAWAARRASLLPTGVRRTQT
jgi:sugar phosphate isomerase/epimerase